jgi:glycosyltransferase involved in cell wall biosynthesis
VNTSDYEGFSNAFIQAWMRRVPVATLTVDPDGLLSRGGLGVVGGTEEGLREAVAGLLDDDAKRVHMGARCRAYAVATHGYSNAARVARIIGLGDPVDRVEAY